MKTTGHPTWYQEAQVVCACGNMFTIGSTKSEVRVEVCSRCHPFFTGETRFLDSMGRVERFQKKQATAATYTATKKSKKQVQQDQDRQPKSLREMLLDLHKK